MPVVFAAAVTLGVAALLFLQVLYGRVFFAGGRRSSPSRGSSSSRC